MIKKIIISLLLIFSVLIITNLVNANCTVNSGIDACLNGSYLVDPTETGTVIEVWFKTKVLDWTTRIAWFLGLMAVWAIVFGSFMMAISTWEEEKIKKAKDVIKWAILWFLWIVLASSLIAIIVNFMYSLG